MAAGLCFIGKVIEVVPITGADRIELATVVVGHGGKWHGVVPKGEYQVGSPCQVYLQDSLVPDIPAFEFMKPRGMRVKMMRLRGCPSECLIMPQTLVGNIGDDVTEMAQVTKYEKPIPLSMQGENYGNFPSFIPKTDEPNFQGVSYLVAALHGKPWVATEKCDGTSLTVYNHEGHIGVCSRNWEKKNDGTNLYWKAAEASGILAAVSCAQCTDIAIQAEVVGPGIQKNPMGLDKIEARVFDIWDIGARVYASWNQLNAICENYNLDPVEAISAGDCFDHSPESLQDLAEGVYPGTTHQREGLVIRPLDPFFIEGERVSFKCLNLKYTN